ncbi:MAG: hypothetical protein KGH87_10030, partial [Thaumarchaeota archaeon]|nr:hypothetical protein [Nitrososphaerota archaeon]
MRELLSDLVGIVTVADKNHYTIDSTQLPLGTMVSCPFDAGLKVGKNEFGEVCIIKKSFFKPF